MVIHLHLSIKTSAFSDYGQFNFFLCWRVLFCFLFAFRKYCAKICPKVSQKLSQKVFLRSISEIMSGRYVKNLGNLLIKLQINCYVSSVVCNGAVSPTLKNWPKIEWKINLKNIIKKCNIEKFWVHSLLNQF